MRVNQNTDYVEISPAKVHSLHNNTFKNHNLLHTFESLSLTTLIVKFIIL